MSAILACGSATSRARPDMPASMNTDSRRKASAEFHAKRKADGWKKVTVWLDPEALFKVDALRKAAGSADEVHRQAIKAWPGPGAAGELQQPAKPKAPKPSKAKPAAASSPPSVSVPLAGTFERKPMQKSPAARRPERGRS
jgi:hypothetical protein